MYKLEFLKDILLTECYFPFKKISKLQEFKLVFDPGCAITLIDTSDIDILGYSAREDGIRASKLDGAAGVSEGYVIKVPIFKCLGQELTDFEIACHDLSSNLGVSGLLGMNFLKHFRMDIDFNTGIIHSIRIKENKL